MDKRLLIFFIFFWSLGGQVRAKVLESKHFHFITADGIMLERSILNSKSIISHMLSRLLKSVVLVQRLFGKVQSVVHGSGWVAGFERKGWVIDARCYKRKCV